MNCSNCGRPLRDTAQFCKGCGTKVDLKAIKKVEKKSHSQIWMVTLVLLVVIGGAGFLVLKFVNKMNSDEEIVSVAESGEQTVTETGSGSKNGPSEEAYAQAKEFATAHQGKWYVKKYYNGDEWKTYDLGKKMLIVAYNFLNDGSFTTGGYDARVKSEYLHSRTEDYDVNSDTTTITDTTTRRDYYEYVPVEYHEYHGADIAYSCPTILIENNCVDMTGMGGAIYPISDFYYKTIDGDTYIVNSKCKFALQYVAGYIQYCEPNAAGYYQGYYAFDPYDSMVNSTVIYDHYEGK